VKFVVAIVLALLLPLGEACSETLFGRVVGIYDGDTITVLDASKTQHKIRLAGIDAPGVKQAFGTRQSGHRGFTQSPCRR